MNRDVQALQYQISILSHKKQGLILTACIKIIC